MGSIKGLSRLHLSCVREYRMPSYAGPVGFKEQQCSPGNVQVHVDAVFGRDPQEICLQGKEKELLFPAKQESKGPL